MSRPLTRSQQQQLLAEHPLVRLFGGIPARDYDNRDMVTSETTLSPSIELVDEGRYYTLEVELPGVNKDALEIRIGEAGRNVTIDGKIGGQVDHIAQCAGHELDKEERKKDKEHGGKQGNVLVSERSFSPGAHFHRTVWFPRPVDAEKVRAKMADGVLIFCVEKLHDKLSVPVSIQ